MIRALCKATGKVLTGGDAIRALSSQTATRIVDQLKPEKASMNHKN